MKSPPATVCFASLAFLYFAVGLNSFANVAEICAAAERVIYKYTYIHTFIQHEPTRSPRGGGGILTCKQPGERANKMCTKREMID